MSTEQKVTRKLRAILSADVKGYSLLMAVDETFTVETLKEYRKILTIQVEQHNGRVVDSPGDNILADFASVVDAVECAAEIQKVLKEKNDNLPNDKRLEFRIGVNIGDVIHDGERIYGHGVNVAARIEGLAEPGGVCISRNAYDHVGDKLNYGYEYLGEHTVKNIKKPVRVYNVLLAPEDAGKLIGEKKKLSAKNWIWPTIVFATIVIASVSWLIYQTVSKPDFEPASIEKMAFPLPDKPSIAVLPFNNLSGDPTQDYIADGISENIISALSKISEMLVIARNSTFTYKDKPVKVQQVSEELGVRYIMEGSAQKIGNRMRITAQLIDATTGHHLWSEKFDRDMKDIFILQDEITLEIIRAMQVQLTEGEQASVTGKGTKNLDAYLKAIQALEQFYQMNKEGSMKAKVLANEAIALDPNYAFPYATLANAHMLDVWFKFSPSSKESIRLAAQATQKALSLDNSDPRIYSALKNLYIMQGQYEKALTAAERHLELSPSGADAYRSMALALRFLGKFSETIPYIEEAIRLDPYPPAVSFRLFGDCYRNVDLYDEAITMYQKALHNNPDDIFTHLGIAATYVKLGRDEEARIEAKEVIRIHPKFSLAHFAKSLQGLDQVKVDDFIESLREAGLPE